MKLPQDCPTRDRIVQGDIYAEYGMEDFSFPMPRPFVEEDFTEVAERLSISAAGLANTANQTLAENLGNNLAQKIKAAAKFNTELAEAQEQGKREDEEPVELPDETTLQDMIEAYDFSGIRTGGGATTAGMSPLQKALYHFARTSIRVILKENGYGEMAAPVTVAKKDTEPKDGQVSYDTFDTLVTALAEGDGPWAEGQLADLREQIVVGPARERVAAEEKSQTAVAVKLNLMT